VAEAKVLVGKIQDPILKQKEETMLEEVLKRGLGSLKVFSNVWNSQSGAENSNSVLHRLKIGPSFSLAVVLDKILAHCVRDEVRRKEKVNSKMNLSPLIAPLATELSQKSFGMLLTQFNEGLNYAVEKTSVGLFILTRRGLQQGTDVFPRTVKRLKNGNWSCSCNRPVYSGILCRHILCVLILKQEVVQKEWVNPRWWRDDLQPKVDLRRKSPFVNVSAEKDLMVADGNREVEVEKEDVNIEDCVGFEEFIEENGGDFGEDSLLDSEDAVVLNSKGKSLEKITAKERRNEVVNRFYQLVQRIGYGTGSIEVLDDLDSCLEDWEAKMLKHTDGMGLAGSIRTTGRPREHALKPGNHKARSNAARSKKTYKCSICKKEGHTAGTKCPEKCWDCPVSAGNHKKGSCSGKRGREEEVVEGRKQDQNNGANLKKSKKCEDGSTVSTSLSGGAKDAEGFFAPTDATHELFNIDVLGNILDANSELRRVSSFNVIGPNDEDLRTVKYNQAYVTSACVDVWCVITNKFLDSKKREDVIVLNMPTSEAIFYDYKSGNDGLEELAAKWRKWKKPGLKHLLIPINIKNEHWCLLVVDLKQKIVYCWDSLVQYDKGEFVESKKTQLFRFLKDFQRQEDVQWKLVIVNVLIPQQTGSNCGIFCIEFMRAFINGCKSAEGLSQHVREDTMKAARAQILQEITQRKIIEELQLEIGEGKRKRSKSTKAKEYGGE
jgi:Ulp1 protease family, C-terminal catalytic domain/SWIM zinc finger